MIAVIAVASQKGGVGKTTTAVNLAAGLAMRGKAVLIVDLDAQGQSGIALGMYPESGVFNILVAEQDLKQVVRATGRPRLWPVPGDKRTATAQTVLLAEGRDILKAVAESFVRPLNGHPDFVVFDTAPSVGGLQESALAAADLVIVPAATDHLALFGVSGVLESLTALQAKGRWSGNVLVLPTFYDDVTRQSRVNLDMLQQQVQGRGVPVLNPIHRATALRECVAEGKSIFEYEPEGRAAREYAELVFRVLEEV